MAVTGRGKYPNHLGIIKGKGKGKGTIALIKQNTFSNQHVLTNDWFFDAVGVTYYGILKRYNGSVWVKEPLKVYNGSIWVSKPLKRWDGTQWLLIDTTGV